MRTRLPRAYKSSEWILGKRLFIVPNHPSNCNGESVQEGRLIYFDPSECIESYEKLIKIAGFANYRLAEKKARYNLNIERSYAHS